MSRRLGEYVPLSVDYADDDAVMACTPFAELLFVRCMCLARRLRSDGYLTEPQIVNRAAAKLGPPNRVRILIGQLVSVGLLERADGGFVVRSFLKWNKSADELGRERARDRDRKRADRTTPETVQPESAGNPGGHETDSTGNPEPSGRNPSSRAPARAEDLTVPDRTVPESPTADAITPPVEVTPAAAQNGRRDLLPQCPQCGVILDRDRTCFICGTDWTAHAAR